MKKLFILLTVAMFFAINPNSLNAQNYTFQEQPINPFFRSNNEDFKTGDIDNDGDIDIVSSGGQVTPISGFGPSSILYLNDGNANFEHFVVSIPIYYSSSVLGDIDGDLDLDLIVFGADNPSGYQNIDSGPTQTKVLKFNGDSLAIVPNSLSVGLIDVSGELTDVDGDSDLDLVVMGLDSLSIMRVKLFKNDGVGNFTEDYLNNFNVLANGSISSGDFDNDGDIDLVFAGINSSNNFSLMTYLNDGSGDFGLPIILKDTFTNDFYNQVQFTRIHTSLLDIDSDNNLDLLVSSMETIYLFKNDGNGNFIESPQYIQNLIDITQTNDFHSVNRLYTVDFNFDGVEEIVLDYTYLAGPSNTSYKVFGFLKDGSGNYIFDADLNYYFLGGFFRGFTVPFDADSDGDIDFYRNSTRFIDFSGFYLYDICFPTYSSYSDTVCVEYVAPSGKIINQTGVYQDTILNSKNCDSIITLDLVIKQVDKTVSVLSDGSLKSNQDNAEYRWGICYPLPLNFVMLSGQINQTFQPLNEEIYAVKITYDGCVDTSDCINYYLNVDDVELNNVKIYPNPTTGEFFISNLSSGYNFIEITDVQGRLVYVKDTKESVLKVDLSAFEKGIYFISIIDAMSQDTKQIFKVIYY
ncbi:MAG: FG-GAP-like repeat-containing protein [Putridiphycobacter sp.]